MIYCVVTFIYFVYLLDKSPKHFGLKIAFALVWPLCISLLLYLEFNQFIMKRKANDIKRSN